MTEVENRIANKVDQKVSLKMQKMKEDIVNEIKNFTENKFTALEEKMKTQMQEMETRLEASVYATEERNGKLEEGMAKVKEETTELKAEVQRLKQELVSVKAHVVANEQYSRKCNIKVFGLPEDKGENYIGKVTEVIKEKMGLEFQPEQIAVAHRVRSQRHPQPVIVQMDAFDTKIMVLKARKKLKGTGISFAEDLCRDLMTVYNRVREDPRIESCWAWNGKVMAMDQAGTVYNVQYGQ